MLDFIRAAEKKVVIYLSSMYSVYVTVAEKKIEVVVRKSGEER